MKDRKEVLDKYYNSDKEDVRLDAKVNRLEFLTTDRYIQRYLKPGCKILEIGAGTGRYSLYYAGLGYDVTAIEYVQNNLDILKSKITSDMNIVAEQGDAVDLSRFSDNTFDIVLVLGPIYHLYTDDEINKCINEAKRVCKDDGVMMFAYLPNDSLILGWGLLGKNLKYGRDNKLFNDEFRIISRPSEIFRAFYIDELENIMSANGIKKVVDVSTSGLAPHFKEVFNDLSDEEFEIWKDYHYSSCEKREVQGYSTHMLYIGKK